VTRDSFSGLDPPPFFSLFHTAFAPGSQSIGTTLSSASSFPPAVKVQIPKGCSGVFFSFFYFLCGPQDRGALSSVWPHFPAPLHHPWSHFPLLSGCVTKVRTVSLCSPIVERIIVDFPSQVFFSFPFFRCPLPMVVLEAAPILSRKAHLENTSLRSVRSFPFLISMTSSLEQKIVILLTCFFAARQSSSRSHNVIVFYFV